MFFIYILNCSQTSSSSFFFLAEGVVTTLSGTNLKWLIVSGQGVPEKSGCKEEIVLSSP